MTDEAVPANEEQPVQDSTPAVEQPANTESNDQDTATFELDGQKVTIDELKAGYLRQADYTKKTQKVAEDQKRYESLLNQLKGQSSNTAVPHGASDDSATSGPNLSEEEIRAFRAREQRETARERMTEWDGFKSQFGIKLTDEEEAAFMHDLANREASGKSVNISEMAKSRFIDKITEVKARAIVEEMLKKEAEQTKTVGPGTGTKSTGAPQSNFDQLVSLMKQYDK